MTVRTSLGFLSSFRTYVPQTVTATVAAIDSTVTVAATSHVVDARPTANLVQEFDMLDLASFTVVGGTVVSQITNKVSSVSWAEATNRPAYDATGLSGKPCMNPNGTSHTIQSTEAAVLAAITNASPYTLYYVAQHASVRLEYVFAGGSTTAASNRAWGQSTSAGGRWRCRTADAATTVVSAEGSGSPNANANIFCWSNDGTSTTLKVNGTAVAGFPVTQTTASLTPTRANLFARPSTAITDYFSGKWGAQLLYSALHDAATQLSVARWLGSRWGIATA